MSELAALPDDFEATGRFGMRVAPGSIATPMFDDEVLRIGPTWLLRERRTTDRPETRSIALDGTTLAELASFAGTDLGPPFSVGHNTPPLVDPARPLRVDAHVAAIASTWFAMAAELLDEVIAAGDPRAAMHEFWGRGLAMLSAGDGPVT